MIIFRHPTPADLSIINQWQQDPNVFTFYNSGDSIASATSIDRYLPSAEGEMLIIEQDELPIGLMSVGFYNLNTVSIAYFIGDPGSRGKGLGGVMLGNFVRYAITRGWQTIHASTSIVNYPSWKALLNASFRFSGTKKDIYQYRNIPGQTFDELSLFIASSCTIGEEQRHQRIAKEVYEQKAEMLEYFKQASS